MANPSCWRTGCAITTAVALAVAICVGLALDQGRFRFTDIDAPTMEPCGTISANASHKRLPAVCMWNTTCTDETEDHDNCCKSLGDGQPLWIEAVGEDVWYQSDALWARWTMDATLTKAADVITVDCDLDSIDLSVYNTIVSCSVVPWGRFDNNGRFTADVSWNASAVLKEKHRHNVSLVIVLGDTKVELKDGDIALPVSTEVGLGSANTAWFLQQIDTIYYPDVKLPFGLWFAAWWWDNEASQVVAGVEPPVVVSLSSDYIPFYSMSGDCSHTKYDDGSAWYSVNRLVQLSDSAVSGVKSLNACMWFLAAMTCTMSIVWCILREPGRHICFDLTCFSATLLFALPTMRGLLPAMPSAGTRYDVLNLYGQLWLVTLSIMLQMAKMVVAVLHRETLQHHLPELPAGAESVMADWVHSLLMGFELGIAGICTWLAAAARNLQAASSAGGQMLLEMIRKIPNPH